MPQESPSADNVARGSELGRLVVEHHADLYRYAYRLAGNAADAEDLTQQTFLIAQQKLAQVREAEKVRGWLFAVLRNCFCRNRKIAAAHAAQMLPGDGSEVPDEATLRDDVDSELVQLAIGELAEEFRLVVLMFYFEELSYKEIAAQLDLPIGTVMSRLSRAKEHLRRRLFVALHGEDESLSTHESPAPLRNGGEPKPRIELVGTAHPTTAHRP